MTESRSGTGLPTTPAPAIDPEVEPYWAGARRGELIVPFCSECDRHFWYPRPFCPRCGGEEIDWRTSPGTGSVYSYTIVRRAFGEWKTHAPFVVAYIQLDEGVTVTGNIVDADLTTLAIGTRVHALFEVDADGGQPILRFIPIDTEGIGS